MMQRTKALPTIGPLVVRAARSALKAVVVLGIAVLVGRVLRSPTAHIVAELHPEVRLATLVAGLEHRKVVLVVPVFGLGFVRVHGDRRVAVLLLQLRARDAACNREVLSARILLVRLAVYFLALVAESAGAVVVLRDAVARLPAHPRELARLIVE